MFVPRPPPPQSAAGHVLVLLTLTLRVSLLEDSLSTVRDLVLFKTVGLPEDSNTPRPWLQNQEDEQKYLNLRKVFSLPV